MPSAPTRPSDDEFDRTTLKAMIAILSGFKLVTSVLIVAYFPSVEAALVVVGLSVLWLLAGLWWAIPRTTGPLRLMRARTKRRRLVRQEWRVD